MCDGDEDFISSALRLLTVRSPEIPRDAITAIGQRMRQQWAGVPVTIRKNGEPSKVERLVDAMRRGVSVEGVAERIGASRQTVWRARRAWVAEHSK